MLMCLFMTFCSFRAGLRRVKCHKSVSDVTRLLSYCLVTHTVYRLVDAIRLAALVIGTI